MIGFTRYKMSFKISKATNHSMLLFSWLLFSSVATYSKFIPVTNKFFKRWS